MWGARFLNRGPRYGYGRSMQGRLQGRVHVVAEAGRIVQLFYKLNGNDQLTQYQEILVKVSMKDTIAFYNQLS